MKFHSLFLLVPFSSILCTLVQLFLHNCRILLLDRVSTNPHEIIFFFFKVLFFYCLANYNFLISRDFYIKFFFFFLSPEHVNKFRNQTIVIFLLEVFFLILHLQYQSGDAYYDRQLIPNFELWVEIFCVTTCFHMRIPKPCLSEPCEKNRPGFVNISPTLVIIASMERSSRVLQHGNPKIWIAWK